MTLKDFWFLKICSEHNCCDVSFIFLVDLIWNFLSQWFNGLFVYFLTLPSLPVVFINNKGQTVFMVSGRNSGIFSWRQASSKQTGLWCCCPVEDPGIKLWIPSNWWHGLSKQFRAAFGGLFFLIVIRWRESWPTLRRQVSAVLLKLWGAAGVVCTGTPSETTTSPNLRWVTSKSLDFLPKDI